MRNIVIYKPFEDRFYEDIKKITLSTFELTSFGVDPYIGKNYSGKIAWENWCKPVIESSKKRYCIVALYEDKPAGYIIYGINREYSVVINKKIGTIILLAVDKKYRGLHIGEGLIRYVYRIYKNSSVQLITVGTDLDNLPALYNYFKFNFRPVLNWATFRFYFFNRLKMNSSIQIIKVENIPHSFLSHIKRENSLLNDKRIKEKNKIINYINNSVMQNIRKRKIFLFAIQHKEKIVGFITIKEEITISKILNKRIIRIVDLIFFDNDINYNIKLLKNFLIFLRKNYKAEIIEIFVELNRWNIIELIERAGFILRHNAVTLHSWLE